MIEGVLGHVRGSHMDLTAGDIGPDLCGPPLASGGECSRLAVPMGEGHAGADGSQDGQPRGSADLAAGVEQA